MPTASINQRVDTVFADPSSLVRESALMARGRERGLTREIQLDAVLGAETTNNEGLSNPGCALGAA